MLDPPCWVAKALVLLPKDAAMLDLAFLLIGVAFLGGCGLYAIACKRL